MERAAIARRQLSACAHPNVSAPGALADSPANQQLLKVPLEGQEVAIMDPQWPAVASVRELGAEAMPPLWQYLAMTALARRVHLRTPRASGSPGGYSCKSSTFAGAAMGAMTSMMAPLTTPSALPRLG
jgi:hypothetical protein